MSSNPDVSRLDARSLLLASMLSFCGACGRESNGAAQAPATSGKTQTHAEGRVQELYGGSARAPVAGLWLKARPVAYFHDPAGSVPELETQKRLADGESVALSRHSKRVVRTRFEKDRTTFDFDGRAVDIRGRAGLALDSEGRTSVAWTLPDEDSGAAGRLSILGADGTVLVEREVERLDWLDVAASGERIAFGSRRESIVLARNGEQLARLRSAERGTLSPDGAWLALEGGRVFSLSRLDGVSVEFKTQDKAVTLAYDDAGKQLTRVTPTALQIYRLDPKAPVMEAERAPPEGFSWRSAAYDVDGRLSAGRIQVVNRPRRQPAKEPKPDLPGRAWLGVDVFSGTDAPAASAVWEVSDWNQRAPEVLFGAERKLYAIAWPSAFEVAP